MGRHADDMLHFQHTPSPTNKKWGTAIGAIARMKKGVAEKKSNEQPQERPRGVAFSDAQKRE